MRPAIEQNRNLLFRMANSGDTANIIELVNSAYRGELSKNGWTTEADLLGGQRTDADEVEKLIAAQYSLIMLGFEDDQLVGCMHLKRASVGTELGMFAIKPDSQGSGVGSRFLAEAEHQAVKVWQSRRLRMQVITLREELIAFYERRGYRRTGKFCPFPNSRRFGIPKVTNLRLEVLEKLLA